MRWRLWVLENRQRRIDVMDRQEIMDSQGSLDGQGIYLQRIKSEDSNEKEIICFESISHRH